MLKIGEFSKIAQVSIKALRFYDEEGLLQPAHVDRYNGYRYYTLSQLVRLNRILALKDLDFTLDQIKELLKLDLPGDVLRNMLQSKADDLRLRINEEHSRLLRVENRLINLQDSPNPRLSPVVIKSAPHQLIASVREVLRSPGDLSAWKGAKLAEIKDSLASYGGLQAGPDILIYHQDEFREADLDVEVGMIIDSTHRKIKKGTLKGSIRLHNLAGVNTLATTIAAPSTSLLSESYTVLTQWTQANGFRSIGPWRELTYTQDEPTSQQIVEVQRPVMKAIEFYTHLEEKEMEPKIITKPAFTLVGLRYFGKNEHGEISEMWETFNQRMEELGGLPHETGEAAIGLCITPDDEPIDGSFEYVAGLPVSEVADVPDGFVVRHTPAHTYAVFAHKGDLPSLGKTYEYIYETWLPQSGYELAAKIDFEYYDKDFKDFAPDSIFYIYIPIKKA